VKRAIPRIVDRKGVIDDLAVVDATEIPNRVIHGQFGCAAPVRDPHEAKQKQGGDPQQKA
jgi:hypothetical protein